MTNLDLHAVTGQLESTPAFVYDEAHIRQQTEQLLAMPHAFWLTVRYAMKANPIKAILRLMNEQGIHIDACSGHEAFRALAVGIPAEHIQITSQQWPVWLEELTAQWVKFCACSLGQLEKYGRLFPWSNMGIRLNPWIGSGQFSQVNVGWIESSFGIWHEYIDQVHEIAANYNLRITTLHTHIGSGTDPQVWQDVAGLSLEFARQFTDVTHVDLGGWLKVGRMSREKQADLQKIGEWIRSQFEQFYEETWRKLHIEIEPGTFLIANAGYLFSRVDDIVNTGNDGYTFMKLDCGMSELIRPAMYGAQHPIFVVNNTSETSKYVVVGHSCESSDMFTVDDERNLATRELPLCEIGDIVVIGGAGAYCSSMNTKHYNSFPSVAEYLWSKNILTLIKRAESREAIWANEV